MPPGSTEAARRAYNWNQVCMDDRLESPFRPFAFMLHMVIKCLLVVEIRLPVEALFELGPLLLPEPAQSRAFTTQNRLYYIKQGGLTRRAPACAAPASR